MEQSNVRVKIGEGGRIVIPVRMRNAVGAKVGDSVTLSLEENSIHITTQKDALQRLQELVRRHVPEGVSLADEMIRDRREEAAREEAKDG